MSGPSLKQLRAHHSIHEGAFAEGKHLFDLLCQLHAEGRAEQAGLVAKALTEHWETRTLAHAESEEEGFYLEKAAQRPELAETITALKRDHRLMRILTEEIKESLPEKGVTGDILDRFRALLQIVQIHSREEEKLLF